MVSERIPGVSLDTVWHDMDSEQSASIKAELKHQLALYRRCTMPYIGRLDRKGTRNVYEKMRFRPMGHLTPSSSSTSGVCRA